jgi:hypothetical protein
LDLSRVSEGVVRARVRPARRAEAPKFEYVGGPANRDVYYFRIRGRRALLRVDGRSLYRLPAKHPLRRVRAAGWKMYDPEPLPPYEFVERVNREGDWYAVFRHKRSHETRWARMRDVEALTLRGAWLKTYGNR